MRVRLTIIGGLLTIALGSYGAAYAEAPSTPYLYILSFNRWGELENPAERDLAIRELQEHDEIERIILFGYGWANDGESSYSTYRTMVDEITSHSPRRTRSPTAVIAVGWDSSQTGFRKLFNNIIPLPGLANVLAWLPDRLLFPLSFWSKSAQADRIGFGGLRVALNQIFAIYEGREDHPEIFLLGHSFGTRILSGLMLDELGAVEVGSEPFVAKDHVRGAVLLQPALVSGNLHHGAAYPVLVTMSRHDHANGFLYPVANVPLNSYGFTLFEAFVQHRILEPVRQTVDTVGDVLTRPLPVGRKPSGELGEPRVSRGRVGRTMHLGRRTLGEALALPLSLAFTLIVTPLDYVYIQIRGLATRPVGHVMDSLAQLPLIEILVEGLDALLGREVGWGQRSKGFFTLGPAHEAMGRMATPRILGTEKPRVVLPAELLALTPLPDGVIILDASEIVSEGAYGLDLGTPLVDFTIGWLDPIGAHSDYANDDVVPLIGQIINPDEDP